MPPKRGAKRGGRKRGAQADPPAQFEPSEELKQLFPDLDLSTFPIDVSPGAPTAELANYVVEHRKEFRTVQTRKRPLAEPPEELEPIVVTLSPGRRSICHAELLITSFTKELLAFYEHESRLPFDGNEQQRTTTSQLLHQNFPLCRSLLLMQLVDELGGRYAPAAVVCFFVESGLAKLVAKYFFHVEQAEWIAMTTLMAEARKRRRNWIDPPASGAVADSLSRYSAIVAELKSSDYSELFDESGGRLKPNAGEIRGRVKTFQCAVCFDDYPVTSAISCHPECEFIDLVEPENSQRHPAHSFCPDCIRGQAGAATTDTPISAGGIGLRCMAPDCKNSILFSDCRSFIPAKVRKVLNDRIIEEVLATAGFANLERCKRCNYAADADGIAKEQLKVFSCLKCSFQYCRVCEREWDEDHVGTSCEEMDERDHVDREVRRVENQMSEAVIRKCPKCQLPFIKQDGCNKMRCRCGITQCYLCRKSSIGYDHFCQHVRNPAQKKCPTKGCTKCLLWEAPSAKDKQALNDIAKEAKKAGVNLQQPQASTSKGRGRK